MKLLPWFGSLLLGMTLSIEAGAQASVTVGDEGVEKTPLDQRFPFDSINRSDCLADGIFRFPFTATGLLDDLNVVVWAASATDCTIKMNRDNDNACWQVAAPTKISPITVRMRDIVSQSKTPGMTTEEVCNRMSETTFILNFLILNGAGANAEGSVPDRWPATDDAEFDLIGPTPPTGLEAGAGEDSVIVSFSASTGASDLDGYRIFCDPSAAAADGGGSTSCGSGMLVAGQPPPDPNANCGSVENTSTEITADNLQNGVSYAVAIGAVDTVGNVGALSEVVCATPKPVTGYYEAYRAAGGTAGGGFCALSRRPSPAAFAIVAAAALGLTARRRRRRA